MPYVDLQLHSTDTQVNALINRVIEPYLVEAHYLLAATRPAEGPSGHFPYACALMLLGTVAATSALDNFERPGKKRARDKQHFLECLRKYFPWDCITIEDGEFRSEGDRREAACVALYEVFRCPLFHSGGLVDQTASKAVLVKTHPGHKDIEVAERRIEQLALASALGGQCLLKLEFRRCVLYVDTFYWCVRRMVERYAVDPARGPRLRAHLQ